jgi:hypothetical protein
MASALESQFHENKATLSSVSKPLSVRDTNSISTSLSDSSKKPIFVAEELKMMDENGRPLPIYKQKALLLKKKKEEAEV